MLLPFLFSVASAGDVVLAADESPVVHMNEVVSPERGVLLLHMADRSPEDWDYFLDRLERVGVAGIAPALSGTTAAEAEGVDFDGMSLLPAVTPHLDWLREQAVTEIVCVGAGLGANLCLHLAVNDPSVSSVVLLSPGINRHNVKIVPALREYGERPLLVVASTEDVYSARSIEVMDRLSDQMSVQMLEGAGSGTVMLNRDAELEGRMMGWILGTDQVNARSLTVPTTAAETEEDSIETSGEKLLIHQ